MIYVALAGVAGLVLATVILAQVVRSLVRQHSRERDLLLNQLYNAVGRPWQPAPAAQSVQEPEVAEYDIAPVPEDFAWSE